MTIGTAILIIALGAILKWAVTAHVNGFNIHTAGTVLLIVGIVGLVLSILYTFGPALGLNGSGRRRRY